MIHCSECKSINVKVNSLDFARVKKEGQPAAKASIIPKQQFICQSCNNVWDSDDEAYKIYYEYCNLILPETTLVARDMRRGGVYEVTHIDHTKMMRRHELAGILIKKYQSYLDLDPSEWHNIASDNY